jgi:two-component system response regulator PilR (NtrC family)
MSVPAKILIVDDQESIRILLTTFFKKEGYEPYYAPNAQTALKLVEKIPFDLALVDIKMPGMDGLTLLGNLKKKLPEMPVIIITAYPSIDSAVKAMHKQAFDYVIKPFNLDELKQLVQKALEQKRSISLSTTVYYSNIITRSPSMIRILENLPKIAATKANVLIMGESGTGKELIARAIHNLSPRKDKPFVTVNCGGIPETLLESELFGYKKGAFTGATSDRIGLFQSADKGTIFLDEIGELSPLLQVKLLRVVEEKSIKPLGSTQEIKIDVRIISATNRDLEKEVIEGRFREDLYFRLNVIPIRIPPLRERKEDIPILAEYFLRKYSKELGKDVRQISSLALSLLMEYDFPGNVRELENIIERSVALETNNVILPESLVISDFKRKKTKKEMEKFRPTLPPEGIDLERTLAEIEKEFLLQALKRAKGVKKEAASLLGLSFRAFRYKLKKYGLDKVNA